MIFSSNLLIISILFTLFIYELNTFVCVAISFTIVLCTIFFLFFRVNFGFSHIYTHKSQIIYYSIFLYIENQKNHKDICIQQTNYEIKCYSIFDNSSLYQEAMHL